MVILSLLTLTYAQSLSSTITQTGKDKFEKATTIPLPKKATSRPKLTISQATMKAINEIRSKPQICSQPVSPLRWNKILYNYAKEHSIDMAVTKRLQHNGSGTATDKTAKRLRLNRGSYFYERVNQKANSRELLSAELVIRTDTASLKSPKDLIKYWVMRPKDCQIIMDPRFSDVALAKVVSNKEKKAYWTLLLAGRRTQK